MYCLICSKIILKPHSLGWFEKYKSVTIFIKISQLPMTLSLFLDNSERSLRETLNELNKFTEISGLKVNYDKTQVIWIGSEINSERKLCSS